MGRFEFAKLGVVMVDMAQGAINESEGEGYESGAENVDRGLGGGCFPYLRRVWRGYEQAENGQRQRL